LTAASTISPTDTRVGRPRLGETALMVEPYQLDAVGGYA
jgi:hypothetical protein